MCGCTDPLLLAEMSARQIVESSPYYSTDAYASLPVTPEALFPIVRCHQCSMTYAGRIPPQEFLDSLYDVKCDVEELVQTFVRPERMAFQLRAISALLAEIARRKNNDNRTKSSKIRILDVGCSMGPTLLALSRQYYPYEVIGVEISSVARKYLAEQGVMVFDSLDSLPNGYKADGILLNDVLEHVPHPVGFMRKVADHLGQGTMWVNVPNFVDWRLKKALAKIEAGDNDVPKDMNPWEHLSYFNPRTLTAFMKSLGLKRISRNEVVYTLRRETGMGSYTRSLVRLVRDHALVQAGRFTASYTTHGLFERSEAIC